jgi:hypothetical protein
MHPQYRVNYHAIVMTNQYQQALIVESVQCAFNSADTSRKKGLQFWYDLERSLQFWYDCRLAAPHRQAQYDFDTTIDMIVLNITNRAGGGTDKTQYSFF